MTQALVAAPVTREAAGSRHEVRDPQTGQLVGWFSADLDKVDESLRQALRLNGLLLVASARQEETRF